MDNLGVQAFNESVSENLFTTAQGNKDILSTGSNPNTPPAGFDSDYYLRENLDVAVAVSSGVYENGWEHWLLHGKEEGRLPSAGTTPDLISQVSENTPSAAKSENDALTNVGIEKQQDWGKLGLSFIENAGQADAEVKYQIKGAGHTFYFTPNEVIFTAEGKGEGETENISSVVRSNLIGSNVNPTIETLEKLPGVANFLNGDDPNQWQMDVSTYEGVVYRNVYEGIDRLYKGTEGHLKGEFIVEAGADAGQIKIQYKGIEDLQLREDGALIIKTGTGELIDSAPYVYQEINGEIKEVESAYKLLGDGTVGFSLGAYDSAHTLVIDPVLVYYQQVPDVFSDGYRMIIGSYSNAIAVDSAGNVYITGSTNSTQFPTVNGYQATAPASNNAFVTKLDASGKTVLYSTYLGGNGDDYGGDIAIDSVGNAYIIGNTSSTDFPTVNPLQPAIADSSELKADTFVAKLNATGNALLYSTYLGRSSEDTAQSIALDGAGNIYVMGSTTSSDFPTLNPLQSQRAGFSDGFVSKLNASGTALIYSTYLGGSGNDLFTDMAVDSAGHVFVTGITNSANFPAQNALQGQMAGSSDGFVSKLNIDGTALVYSTYLGGSEFDGIYGIAVDSSGNAYVRGSTDSNNFPLKNALPIEKTTALTAFVSKLNAGGTLGYSTYLASSSLPYDNGSRFGYSQDNSSPGDIAVDNLGNVYTRITESYFSSTDTFEGSYSSLFKINPLGNSYTLSRSKDSQPINDIAVDNGGSVYIILSNLSRGRYYAASDDTIAKYNTSNPLFTFAELLELESQGKEPTTLYFDEKYYLANNRDVAADVAKGNYAGGALEHYQKFGQLENRQPSLLFDPILYLEQNPDVKDAVQKGVYRSAWEHFARYGQYEERDARLQIYDEGFYLENNPDVKRDVEAGVYRYGFEHFIRNGQFEKRDPSALFNTQYYLATNPDVAEDVSRGGSAFNHFVRYGISENRPNLLEKNRNPSNLFNANQYLNQDEGLAAATAKGEVKSGIFHYLKFGQFEGRTPRLKLFDEKFYLENNADVAAEVSKGTYRSGYEHFIRYGQTEKRRPSDQYDEAFYLANNADVAADVAKGLYRSGFEHFVNYGVVEGRAGIG
ncbi:MAG: SBBP repeat-containing protein [Microcoleus vaginatus WJT46-NPBG5]|nr:SBBP repeat-containing protein [Microcoleus vaginatus WJT46-NPBG5]